jgi:hypothetical protein
MNLEYVRNLAFEPILHAYEARDSAVYALSLVMGEDPLDEDELPYVYEGRGALAVPSLCVTLGWPPFWRRSPVTGIAWRRILHGEQSFRLFASSPPPAACAPSRASSRPRARAPQSRRDPLHRARSHRRRERGADRSAALGRIAARRRRRRRLRRAVAADAAAGPRREARRCPGLSHRARGSAALSAGEPRLHADSRRSRHGPRGRIPSPHISWAQHVRPRLPRRAEALSAAPAGVHRRDGGALRRARLPRRYDPRRIHRDGGRLAFPRARAGARRAGARSRRGRNSL